MSAVVGRVKSAGTVLWNHKKKFALAAGLFAYGIDSLRTYNRDGRIRALYALQAKKHGEMTIAPDQRLKRVTVLLNKEANGRKVVDRFKANALSLLNLAGVDVTVIEVKNAEEMESMGRALDKTETDCIYVVGGDGTVSRVVSGLMTAATPTNTPICVFPGGRQNAFLKRVAPRVFGEEGDVRRYCESAMAILEESRREVSPVKCEIINNANADESKVFYILSGLKAGWLEHCEHRKPKMWYFGALRAKAVYFLEFLKRFPEPMSLRLSYTEFCGGCSRCRVRAAERERGRSNGAAAAPSENGRQKSWLSSLLGNWSTVKNAKNGEKAERKAIDYSRVVNERCGVENSLTVDTADLEVLCTQHKDCSGLEFKSGGTFSSRFDAMRRGWAKEKGKTTDSVDNSSRFSASKIVFQFMHIPEFIQRLSIDGDWAPFENFAEKSVRLEATDRKIDIYLPKTSTSRFELENC